MILNELRGGGRDVHWLVGAELKSIQTAAKPKGPANRILITLRSAY